eukprot:3119277-Rhodomonas_salina.1
MAFCRAALLPPVADRNQVQKTLRLPSLRGASSPPHLPHVHPYPHTPFSPPPPPPPPPNFLLNASFSSLPSHCCPFRRLAFGLKRHLVTCFSATCRRYRNAALPSPSPAWPSGNPAPLPLAGAR